MKLCDRCRVSGCLLTYGGKACREARKQTCIKCCLEWLREPTEVL